MSAMSCFTVRAAVLGALLGSLSACANFGTTTSDSAQLDISPTAHSIYEGEIVTVTTRSLNTLGRDCKIEWHSSGGDLDTERGDRIARVKFDKPGVYTISAKLVVDGEVVDSDDVEVRVRELYHDDEENKS